MIEIQRNVYSHTAAQHIRNEFRRNSIHLHALSTASDMCCHLFTNASDTWYLTFFTFPFAGLHKFPKNLGPISKLLVPEG